MAVELRELHLPISDVILVQYQDAQPGYTWDLYRSSRKSWGIVYILSGSALYIYENGRIDWLSAGDLVLIPPTAAYRFSVPENDHCSHYTISFLSPDTSHELLAARCAQILKPIGAEKTVSHFKVCVNLWNGRQMGSKMLVISRLYEIVHDFLMTAVQLSVSPVIFIQVAPAQKYIAQHYEKEIRIEQLAGQCHLSVTHFRRIFKQVYGVAPVHYLQRIRVEKAKDYLQSYQYSLDEIAEKTGFQSANYMIRVFRQHTGETPAQYRNNL